MKNIFKTLLFLLVIFSQGCMDQETEIRDNTAKGTSVMDHLLAMTQAPSPAYGWIVLTSQSPIGSNYHTYSGLGYYFDQAMGTGGALQDAGSLDINSITIPQRSDFAYESADQGVLQGLIANPGPLNVQLSGNPAQGFPNYSISTTMPLTMTAQVNSFSKTNGISLTWNQANPDDQVFISLRDEDYTKDWNQLVPDNGNFQISSAELADFNAGERLEIMIGRAAGDSQTLPASNGDESFVVAGITYQSETYILQ